MTANDFLLSAPVPVEPGQCYRLSVQQRANSSKAGGLLLQLDWKDKNNLDLHPPTIVRADARAAPSGGSRA